MTINLANDQIDLHELIPSGSSKQKSVVFISFHKCATSYFSNYVLNNVQGLNLIDFLKYLYDNKDNVKPCFKENGYVYGVLRLQNTGHPRYDFVNELLASNNFNNLKHLFWVRDPRDIIVSEYYSFKYTHGYSKIKEHKEYQDKRRNKMLEQSIDDYVLHMAPLVKDKFLKMQDLINNSSDYLLLKYEDMIVNFESFYHALSKFIPLNADFYEAFYQDTRPREQEKIDSHKRSGAFGEYASKLQPQTINILNEELSVVLDFFKYK